MENKKIDKEEAQKIYALLLEQLESYADFLLEVGEKTDGAKKMEAALAEEMAVFLYLVANKESLDKEKSKEILKEISHDIEYSYFKMLLEGVRVMLEKIKNEEE